MRHATNDCGFCTVVAVAQKDGASHGSHLLCTRMGHVSLKGRPHSEAQDALAYIACFQGQHIYYCYTLTLTCPKPVPALRVGVFQGWGQGFSGQ